MMPISKFQILSSHNFGIVRTRAFRCIPWIPLKSLQGSNWQKYEEKSFWPYSTLTHRDGDNKNEEKDNEDNDNEGNNNNDN